MNSNKIRNHFLQFFESKKHQIVASSPIAQKNDPTLMFTNSGMVPFKEVFLGHEAPLAPRVADSQKCLRVSGKHNDLDDVGKDTYHHTMFEMLGNWSFNDYFKEEAIAWAWEFLTEEMKIPKENLYVTIFEGDEKEGLQRDSEAFEIWKKYITEERILNGNKEDNFWEMGDQGPCGPCSEIHVDLRTKEEKEILPGAQLVNQDHPLVVEIWNLVFMENLRKSNGEIVPLETKNIDTGMGFERLCMVMQGKTSNYDTDLFVPLLNKLSELTGFQYGKEEPINIAMRVIVDHIRTLAFCIADGEIPSNTGAGFVVRRILRRALGYGYRYLNGNEPFLYQLIDTLIEVMGDAYPELIKQKSLIVKVIKEEESSFLRTIEKGLNRLEAIMMEKGAQKIIDGKKVYELKDTYGFPPDFSRIIAEENGFTIDEQGFLEEEKRIRDISRGASESETSDWEVLLPQAAPHFMGHAHHKAKVHICRYRKVKNAKGVFYQLELDQTPFYAEGGGQVGDTGFLKQGTQTIKVLNTKKELGIHYSLVSELPQQLDQELYAEIDVSRRTKIKSNHTATHLVHEALREVLGKHVEQKGSLVSDKELRFDFSHFSKVTSEELKTIESQVNEKIQAHIPLQEFSNISIEEALDKGAMALFGEKYGEKVRMIQFGSSKELCGGSHVPNTAQLIYFKLQSESSVAAGVRRIHAITGNAALDYFKDCEAQLEEVSALMGNPAQLINSITKQKEELASLQKELEKYQKESAQNAKGEWEDSIEKINGFQYIGRKSTLDPSSIKDLIFQLKKEHTDLVVIIASENQDKALISIGLSENISSLNAGEMVRELAKEIQGGGGGQPHFATAGGKNVAGLDTVLSKAKDWVEKI